MKTKGCGHGKDRVGTCGCAVEGLGAEPEVFQKLQAKSNNLNFEVLAQFI